MTVTASSWTNRIQKNRHREERDIGGGWQDSTKTAWEFSRTPMGQTNSLQALVVDGRA